MKIKIFDSHLGKTVLVDKISKTNDEWAKILPKDVFEITTNKGTERPFTCQFAKVFRDGIYQCVRCGTDLFYAKTQFDSGTGWPSYTEPVSEDNLIYREDDSAGMRRTEVLCARCEAHLGHVFDDGPAPSGKRFCINGLAIKNSKEAPHLDQATFGAGCFWHVEEAFSKLKGVIDTAVGFAGGTVPNPSYERVCQKDTGHAEVVHLKFDPKIISYETLLDFFWTMHDPTTLNRQGPDVGEQYRSAIFYYSSEQKQAAEASRERLEQSHRFKSPIVTQILPADDFFKAEEYHQKYFEKQGR